MTIDGITFAAPCLQLNISLVEQLHVMFNILIVNVKHNNKVICKVMV